MSDPATTADGSSPTARPRTADGSEAKASVPAGYDAARTAVTIADLEHHGRLEVRGREATGFLHNLCTNDIVKLPIGQGCEAFFLDLKGRILAFAVAYKGDESLWLDYGPAGAESLAPHLERYAIISDVELLDRRSTHAHWHLAGPKAADVLHTVCPRATLPAERYAFTVTAFAGSPVLISRQGRGPVAGYDLFVPRSAAAILQAQLQESGQALGLQELTSAALEALRIEAGLPLWGTDITDDNFPQEIGRDRSAINLTKGCYLGQETVARIDSMGHVNRMLAGLRIDGTTAAAGDVLDGERVVGRVTSSVYSPACGAAIALALVRTESAVPGRRLRVVGGNEPRSAEVVTLPFVADVGP